jgi:MFS family permease
MDSKASNDTNKWIALFIAGMASFLIPFSGSSVIIATPLIGKEYTMDAIAMDWIVTSYLLAAAMFLVPFGRLADIIGRKKIFTFGIILSTIGSALTIFSPSGIVFIALRVFQGIGGSMIHGTGTAIVTSAFPPAEKGKALGINAAAVYIGLSLGAPIGGILTEHFGWRSIFVLATVLSLIIVIVILWKLKGEWAEAKGEKFDMTGSIIYCLALLSLIYGFSVLPSLLGLYLVPVGVAGLALFIFWESRTKSPVLNTTLLIKSLTFLMSNIAALINYLATFAVSLLLSLYLQYIKGFGPQTTGLILIIQPVLMALLSPIAGRLSDKIEPRLIASVGMAFTTVGLAMLIFLNQDTNLTFIFISLIILGVGFGFFSSPNTNAVMSSVEKRSYGVASGTLGTMRLIGQMLSMGIVMLTFALYIGSVQITPEYYPLFLLSSRTTFIIFAVLGFGGIFASLARGKTQRNL